MAFNKEELSSVNIVGPGTFQVYTGTCTLDYLNINTTSSGTLLIIDGVAGIIANKGTLQANHSDGTRHFHTTMDKGIRLVLNGPSDVTVSYHII